MKSEGRDQEHRHKILKSRESPYIIRRSGTRVYKAGSEAQLIGFTLALLALIQCRKTSSESACATAPSRRMEDDGTRCSHSSRELNALPDTASIHCRSAPLRQDLRHSEEQRASSRKRFLRAEPSRAGRFERPIPSPAERGGKKRSERA